MAKVGRVSPFFCSNNFIYLLFYFLATLLSMQDLDSLTRVQSRAPAVEVQSLNRWTTREALQSFLIHLLILVVCFGKKNPKESAVIY